LHATTPKLKEEENVEFSTNTNREIVQMDSRRTSPQLQNLVSDSPEDED